MARRSTRYPACIISTSVFWYTMPSKTCRSDWRSPRAGVAVTPTTRGPSGRHAWQYSRMRRYEGAGAWCASSMTIVWKSGTSRASRGRRLRVCTLATTVGAVSSARSACTTPKGHGWIDEVQLVHGLLDQLIPVRQDQGAASTPLDEQGEDDRFARPGGEDQQGPLHPARGGGQE